ncbi:MAG TPA: ParB/RepB/Spo0J family partition protein [Clostridiales bacterium]|jgi:ParB family chromosome partitioning protein|nr:ParB/RepB/Spo0J family partition protein [Clostridiales bacterium]
MSKKQAGLGRDLYSLFDDNFIENKKSAGVMLKISDIEPRKNQPRKNFDRESLESLADSIANCGVLQPIIVHENLAFPGTYEIIAGERRWRAARMAGLSEIPAIVLTGDELQMAQVSLVENLQREDLNPVEEAWAYMDLIERFGLTQEQVASKVGKSRSAVTNTLRLLDLPEEVLELLRSGELSAGHARALLGLSDKKSMVSVAEKIIQKQLSVREVELLIKKMNSLFAFPDNQDDDEKYILEGLSQRKVYMKELERKVMQALGRRVKISCSPKKKVLELSYENDEDLESLLTLLCGESLFASDTIL